VRAPEVGRQCIFERGNLVYPPKGGHNDYAGLLAASNAFLNVDCTQSAGMDQRARHKANPKLKWHLDLSRLYPSARQRGFNEAAERGPLAPVRPSGAGTSVYIVQATREPTPPFRRLFFLEPVPLGAEIVNFGTHPSKKEFN